MSETGTNKYINHWTTPEPRCIPGYTGHLRGTGPSGAFQIGKTYGQMSHDLMTEDPISNKRLVPLADKGHVGTTVEDDGCEREKIVKDVTRKRDTIPGYAGHIPRRQYLFGKSYVEETKEASEDFQRFLDKAIDIPRIPPPQNIFPTECVVEDIDLKSKRQLPKYSDYLNPMNYNEMLSEIWDLKSRSKCVPGRESYGTGKVLDVGVSSVLNQGVPSILDRPAMKNWYKGKDIPAEELSQLYCQSCGHSANYGCNCN